MGFAPFLLARAIDLLCPERCAACAEPVGAAKLFCQPCQSRVRVLGPPECARCGQPLTTADTCAACAGSLQGPIRSARAFAAYGTADQRSPVAEALASFKYRGLQRIGRRMALAMLTRAPATAPSAVVPVPLHPRQLRRRGYNQSAVLARHLATALNTGAALGLLTRVRDTRSQTALTAIERAANVAGAFAVTRPSAVRDRTLLLVDDVWTSGSTARAAAAALADADARAIDVLTFARVL